ncbi:MAG: DsbE family thiol:disulfide interchange protein [Gammaproteobacteria bacterium]
MKRTLLFSSPIIVLLALVAVFWRGLYLDPRILPSPLIGKSVPAFSLPRLDDPRQSFTQQEFLGKISILNVWATWCVACRDEQQTLVQFAKQNVIPVYGLDYKDDHQDALDWLAQKGNPYAAVAFDATGNVAINWGVYGAPETFLIDQHGIIRYKYIGPLTPDVIQNNLLPRIEALRRVGT